MMRKIKKNQIALTGCVALFALVCVALPGAAFADDHDHSMATSNVSAPTPKVNTQANPHDGGFHGGHHGPPPPHHGGHHEPPPPHHGGHHGPPPPPPEVQVTHVYDYNDYNDYSYYAEDSLYDRGIGFIIGGSILIATGAGMGIGALCMEEDEDFGNEVRLAIGITGAVTLGIGVVFAAVGGSFLHEWKSGDYAFSVAPTFNGAVFNMTF